MKVMFYFKGNTDGRAFPKYLGLARYYGKSDQVLLLPVPLNWVVIAFDIAMHFARKGFVLRCDKCRKKL